MVETSKDLVFEKIESLRNCIERLREKTPSSLAKLKTDLDAQDIVSINLERASQMCVDIAAHVASSHSASPAPNMAENFNVLKNKKIIKNNTALRMIKAVGLRNLLVHEYKKIDWKIIYIVLKQRLVDFEIFAREITRHLS